MYKDGFNYLISIESINDKHISYFPLFSPPRKKRVQEEKKEVKKPVLNQFFCTVNL